MTNTSGTPANEQSFSKQSVADHDAKAVQWLGENRAVLAGYNAWVVSNGLPLDKYRQF